MAQQFSTNLGLSALPEIDQNKYQDLYVEILRLRGALRVLQSSLDTYTGILGEDSAFWSVQNPDSWIRLQGLSRVYLQATEAISAGAIVNFYDSGTALVARNANASAAGKPARAYSTGNVAINGWGEFILCGAVSIGGLTRGATYYLSNTNGLISGTAGTVSQVVGYALSTTRLFFNPVMI